MIRDAALWFAQSQRPATHATMIGAGPVFNIFPSGYEVLGAGPSKTLDLRVASDFGNGMRRLVARFTIKTTFAGSASNKLSFAVGVSSHPSFQTSPTILVRGEKYATPALTAGVVVQLVIPPLNSYQKIGSQGLQYLGLGIEVEVPSTDWTDGLVDAELILDSEGDTLTRGSNYASGYSV